MEKKSEVLKAGFDAGVKDALKIIKQEIALVQATKGCVKIKYPKTK